MSRRKVSTTIYISPEQNELLKALNARTKVPIAEYIRQGIDLILSVEGQAWMHRRLAQDVERGVLLEELVAERDTTG